MVLVGACLAGHLSAAEVGATARVGVSHASGMLGVELGLDRLALHGGWLVQLDDPPTTSGSFSGNPPGTVVTDSNREAFALGASVYLHPRKSGPYVWFSWIANGNWGYRHDLPPTASRLVWGNAVAGGIGWRKVWTRWDLRLGIGRQRSGLPRDYFAAAGKAAVDLTLGARF